MIGMLARYVMLNFLGNPLMRACEPLMSRIVNYRDPDQEAFIVQGYKIELTIQDIYFLTGLSPLEVVGEIHPVLRCGRHIEEFAKHHCVQGGHAKGMTIRVDDLERLETRAIAAMVLWICGSHAFHHIA